MGERKISVKIDAMGNPVIEAHNFSGQGCEEATKNIEQALSGGEGVERVIKPEWYQSEDEQEQESQGLSW